jgi:thioredoxin reductase
LVFLDFERSGMTNERYDVVVIGGGIAGLSAALYTARADLDTLVVNDGVSTLERNAILENFPGFPAGIDPRLFCLMLDEQVERAGCSRLDARAEAVRSVADGFVVRTDGETVDADRVVAASWADCEYLDPLDVAFEGSEGKRFVTTAEGGRTDVDGVYAAGRLANQYHQAIVAAGHGSQVGLTVVGDADPEFYNDWVVPEGYFTNRGYEVPEGCEEIGEAERRRRARRGHDRLRSYLENWEDETPVPHPSFVEDLE